MEYKKVPQYENYIIYNNGTVFSNFSNKFLNPSTSGTKNNYLKVILCNSEGKKGIYIHKLVAENFIEKPEGKFIIDHINHDTLNNNVSNLRYITYGCNTINRSNKFNKYGCTGVSLQKQKIVNNKIIRTEAYRVQITTPDKISIRKCFSISNNPNALEDAIKFRKELENQYYPNIKVM